MSLTRACLIRAPQSEGFGLDRVGWADDRTCKQKQWQAKVA